MPGSNGLRGALAVATAGRALLAVGDFQRLSNFERICTGMTLSGTTGVRACASLFLFALCAHYWDQSIVINPDCAFMESPIFFSFIGFMFVAESVADKWYKGRIFLEPIQAPLKCLMAALVGMASMPHSYVWWQNLLVVFLDMFVALCAHCVTQAYREGAYEVAEHHEAGYKLTTLASSIMEDSIAIFFCVLAMLFPIAAVIIAGLCTLCLLCNSVYAILYCLRKKHADPYRRGLAALARHDPKLYEAINNVFDKASDAISNEIEKGSNHIDSAVNAVDKKLSKAHVDIATTAVDGVDEGVALLSDRGTAGLDAAKGEKGKKKRGK